MTDLNAEILVQLIRHLGHDIRAPLGSLISTTDMLASGVYDPITEKQAKAADRMRRNGQRTLAMIDDFVAYVKAEAGQLEMGASPFDVRALLDSCCQPLREAAEKKGLAFSLDTAPNVPQTLMGDQTAIKRIITALLWNAVAFTASGSIVVMSDWESSAGWSVTVRDTGSGISPLDVPFIFQPFWRGTERPQVPTAGAGLGLPVAQALARLMGGKVNLKSANGAGSTFCLEVPLKTAVTAEAKTQG